MDTGNRNLLLWLTLFAVAFGYIEGAVVVYLRELYYPGGFSLDLQALRPRHIVTTEVAREAASLLLLLSVARLSVRGGLRRFAVFAFCFGVWDLIFYLTLKLLLDWPLSLLDWDILFLIPVPWTAPVLAPVLVSLGLITAGVMLLLSPEERLPSFTRRDWLIESGAGLVILATFFWALPNLAAGRPPGAYPWWLFAIGFGGGAGWFVWRYRLARHSPAQDQPAGGAEHQ
ncbi:MAG: hypothetical protein IID13_04710 [Candidatus Marinimicrobia bacterium]|nr:hypothetical protein [Candidatus Neomarinimicrobiota bacterium]